MLLPVRLYEGLFDAWYSTNGTFVNDNRVLGKSINLQPFDTVCWVQCCLGFILLFIDKQVRFGYDSDYFCVEAEGMPVVRCLDRAVAALKH